jgi:2-phosphoglycerate kinase
MVISLLLVSCLAIAQDFKNVQQGETVPFSGTILTPDAIAKIITTEDAKLQTCQEDWKHQINTLTINKDVEIQKLKHDLETTEQTKDRIIAEKDKEIERTYELVKKQNKNLTPLWISIGLVSGIASTLGTIYVYEKATNE